MELPLVATTQGNSPQLARPSPGSVSNCHLPHPATRFARTALDAIDLTDPPLSSSSYKALIYWCLESLRTARQLGHLLLFRKVKAHGTDNSLDTRGNNRADTLAELGRRTDQDHHLTSFPHPLFLTPSSPPCTTEPAASLPCTPDTTAASSNSPPAWTRMCRSYSSNTVRL